MRKTWPFWRTADLEAGREGVDDRAADAVQATGHLVAAATELAAGVQLREHELDGADLLDRVDVGGDAAAVVAHADAAVGQERHVDRVGVAGERLVDGVVDDLVDEVVQTAGARRPDVHARALAHGLEALEHGDRARVVVDAVGTIVRRMCSGMLLAVVSVVSDTVLLGWPHVGGPTLIVEPQPLDSNGPGE